METTLPDSERLVDAFCKGKGRRERIPNQDQNVIQQIALIFVGKWSVVLSIVDSIASAPEFVRRVLILVNSVT